MNDLDFVLSLMRKHSGDKLKGVAPSKSGIYYLAKNAKDVWVKGFVSLKEIESITQDFNNV